MNGHRRGLISVLPDPRIGMIWVEDPERLVRLGISIPGGGISRAEPLHPRH